MPASRDLESLIAAWSHWNVVFFDGVLKGPPEFCIGATVERTYGAWAPGRMALYPGFLQDFSGPIHVGCRAAHIVLHEMAHHWVQQSAGGDRAPHGEKYRQIANQVGRRIGQPHCRSHDLWCWPDQLEDGVGPYHATTGPDRWPGGLVACGRRR